MGFAVYYRRLGAISSLDSNIRFKGGDEEKSN
jgi:hypothetical protein